MKISILQLNTIWEDPIKNIEIIGQKIQKISKSDICVLPEMFNTGFSNNVKKLGEPISGKTVSEIKRISAENNTAICGSIILEDAGNYYNSFLFVEPSGKIFRYDKRHLFRFGGEDKMFSKGTKRVVVNYKNFRILLQICYDLRFPVWSRNKNDYDMIFYIANWPESRRSAFDILLKARAIENQAFVVAVNRIGVDGANLNYNGGSCFIDYKGNDIKHCTNNTECVESHDFEINELHNFRKNFPAMEDMD